MIALLSDRPDAIPALAAGYRAEWAEWYGPEGPGDALRDLTERCGSAAIPFGVVALAGERPVGTAAVTGTSIASHAHWSPWLTGLWVAPEARGQGFAAAMIETLCAEARRREVVRLHVATERGRALFERLGWRLLEVVRTEGTALSLLAVRL